jgi:hypothetical protein
MKSNFSTHSLPLKWFAYLGKILATIFGVAFGVFYLVPAVQVSTSLPLSIIILMILLCMLVFEMILHFGLASFVEGLLENEFRITDFFGVMLCGIVVGYVSIHSTEKSFLKNIKGLKNLDSLQKIQDFEQKKLVQNYESQLQKLESITLPALQNLQTQNQWAYLSALKIYESNHNSINSEKNESLAKLEKTQKYVFSKAEIHNQITKQKHEKSQKQDTENAKYLGLFFLIFSIYSTLVIGTYRKKTQVPQVQNEVSRPQIEVSQVQNEIVQKVSEVLEVQNDLKIQDNNVIQVVPQVQNTIMTEQNTLQNQTQININISAPAPTKEDTQEAKEEDKTKKISLPVQQAKDFMLVNNYLNDENLTDKEKCLTIMEMFKISRGTYYRIKAELKK